VVEEPVRLARVCIYVAAPLTTRVLPSRMLIVSLGIASPSRVVVRSWYAEAALALRGPL
jgi:hypothetical protein